MAGNNTPLDDQKELRKENKTRGPVHDPKGKRTEWEGMGITGSAQQAEEYADEYDSDNELPEPGPDGLTPTSSPGGSMRRKKDQ